MPLTEQAKATVFWSEISPCINNTRKQCDICWTMTPSQPHGPPTKPFVLSYPFEGIDADYLDLAGHNYLIAVDSFSDWPEVLKVNPVGNNSGAEFMEFSN